MALKEYHKIDLETGMILDVSLFDDIEDVPEDYKLGWGERQMFSPIWSFEHNDWIESKPFSEILQVYRDAKDFELNQACNDTILAGFDYEIDGVLYHFSYDKEAQQNFTDAQTILSDGLVQELMWTVQKDGEYTRIPINKAVMDKLKVVIMMHKTSCISKYRDVLMKIVNEAQTIEEIESVTWA